MLVVLKLNTNSTNINGHETRNILASSEIFPILDGNRDHHRIFISLDFVEVLSE